ncbi:relaxase/mobilization nuclease domain-containing protein [Pacificibacter marinus]|nr:relaxase/mobilization nuclease domain-containing protein [Pacificibacter marinus]
MMVKFFNHGQGKAAPAVNYLIDEVVVDYDQHRQPKRDAADKVKRTRRSIMPEVLKGHPERMIDLVDAVPHRWKYKSGVLSFAAEDAPSEAKQRQLMEDFEAFACPGLQHDRCRMLWVRHLHAGRVELHFLMPRMDLLTGKSLNVAPPGHEKSYMAFMDLHNRRHGWADPMDPARARAVKTVTEAPERAQTRAEVNEWVETQVEFGVIHDRKTLLRALKGIGFEIPRAGEIYVTVADPDLPKNRWRLKGAYFNVDWTADTTQPPHPTEHGSDARGSARLAAIPIGELERRVTEDCAKRRTYNLERFGRPEKLLSRHDPAVEGRGRTPQDEDRNLKSGAGTTAPKAQQDRDQKDGCSSLIRSDLSRSNDSRHRISRRENRDNTATRTIDAADPRAADRQPDYPWRRGLGASDRHAAGAGARKVPNRHRYEPNLFENGVIPDDPNTTRERVARLRRRIGEDRLRVHAAAARAREGARRLAEQIERLVVDLAGRLRGRVQAARPGQARNAEENRLHLQVNVNGTNGPEH